MKFKTIRIFSQQMAIYLMNRGFNYVNIVPDKRYPQFINWIFPSNKYILSAIEEYKVYMASEGAKHECPESEDNYS